MPGIAHVVTLHSIKGEKLVLKFNADHALSSAKLGKQDVAQELRYINESHCTRLLYEFGFDEIAPKALPWAQELQRRLAKLKLSPFRVQPPLVEGELHRVYLCEAEDANLIHKHTVAVLGFDPSTQRFLETVKLWCLDRRRCNMLMKGDF